MSAGDRRVSLAIIAVPGRPGALWRAQTPARVVSGQTILLSAKPISRLFIDEVIVEDHQVRNPKIPKGSGTCGDCQLSNRSQQGAQVLHGNGAPDMNMMGTQITGKYSFR